MFYSLYDYLWFFMIYAVVGWMIEVAYAAVDTGKLSNRGFLNGPLCPIYGCGMVIVIFVLTPVRESVALIFAGSVILTSVLEFITGAVLEKLFNTKWWDYSDEPFNIKGYICLKFSLGWGIGGVFLMKIIQPGVLKMVRKIPETPGKIALLVFMVSFICDLSITIRDMVRFGMKLRSMEVLTAQLRNISDSMAQNIYDGVISTQKGVDEIKDSVVGYTKEGLEKTKELQAKYDEVYKKYENLVTNSKFTNHRFTKAFPNMKKKIGKTKDFYTDVKDKYTELKNKYNELVDKVKETLGTNN